MKIENGEFKINDTVILILLRKKNDSKCTISTGNCLLSYKIHLHTLFPLKKDIAKKSFQDPQGSNQQKPVKIISESRYQSTYQESSSYLSNYTINKKHEK